MGCAAERDEVADRHLGRGDEDAVDQYFDQLAPTREGRLVQPVGDGRPEGLHVCGEHSDLRLLLRARRELVLVPCQVGEAPFQRPHTGLQLFEGDRLGGVGVDEPLALTLERGTALPQVVLPGGAGIVVEPPGLRSSHRLGKHRRVAEHLTDVGPDRGIEGGGGNGVGCEKAIRDAGCQVKRATPRPAPTLYVVRTMPGHLRLADGLFAPYRA